MALNRNKLYTILFIACVAGYIWLSFSFINGTGNKSFGLCFIKHTTNIPCPSCGSTRSVISLSHGNFSEAFMLNPLGYVVALIMLVCPLWIAIDIATKKKTLFEFYRKVEIKLRRPGYAIPLIMLLVFNWIWNIIKGV